MTDTKEKTIRIPRNAENIEKGALELSLQEKAALCKKLKASITEEVETKKQLAAESEKIASDL